MIECKNDKVFDVLKRDYDDFILIMLLSFVVLLCLGGRLSKALFRSFIIILVFLIIEVSCYHLGYIKAIFLSMIIGFHLENLYGFIYFYVLSWIKRRKMKIKKLLDLTEENDDHIKDEPDETK
ncbi:hypothetical protein HpBT060_14770 [Helicobacter pylori]